MGGGWTLQCCCWLLHSIRAWHCDRQASSRCLRPVLCLAVSTRGVKRQGMGHWHRRRPYSTPASSTFCCWTWKGRPSVRPSGFLPCFLAIISLRHSKYVLRRSMGFEQEQAGLLKKKRRKKFPFSSADLSWNCWVPDAQLVTYVLRDNTGPLWKMKDESWI